MNSAKCRLHLFLCCWILSLSGAVSFGGSKRDTVQSRREGVLPRRELQRSDSCSGNQNAILSQSILVDLKGSPLEITQTEIRALEEAIRSTYNTLSLTSCGALNNGFRVVNVARLITDVTSSGFRDMFSTRDTTILLEETFTLEFRLNGLCQQCEKTGAKLFVSNSTCGVCRAPTETLYTRTLTDRVQTLRSSRILLSITTVMDVAELESVFCDQTPKKFQTNVLVGFVGISQELLGSNLVALENTFRSAYNSLNSLNSKTCDLFFRQVDDVSVILDGRLSRRLQDVILIGNEDGANVTNSTNTTTTLVASPFAYRFEVTGTCLGCDENATRLFDDGITSPFNTTAILALTPNSQRRRMQQTTDCRCPIEATYRGPLEQDFQAAFNRSALFLRNESLFEALDGVTEALEVEQVPCDSNQTEFVTAVELEALAITPNLTNATLATLENQFLSSYNNLAERFCDPLFRTVQGVKIVNASLLNATETANQTQAPTGTRRLQGGGNTNPSNTTNAANTTVVFRYRFTYSISGRCRGCPRNERLFDEGARRRNLAEITSGAPERDHGLRRRLQTNNTCWCAAITVVQGAPTQREFSRGFEEDVKVLANDGVLEELTEVVEVAELSDGNETSEIRVECTVDADCQEGELCLDRTCIHRGAPRFTLQWEGDDDYDLSVITPDGTLIDWEASFDSVSGGRFDTRGVQTVFAPHVESIYFPVTEPPPGGNYMYKVTQFTQRGASDSWSLRVFLDDEMVEEEVGSGSSAAFSFTFGEVADTTCDVSSARVQCCNDSDCTGDQTCVAQACKTTGSPMIVLSYYGGKWLGPSGEGSGVLPSVICVQMTTSTCTFRPQSEESSTMAAPSTQKAAEISRVMLWRVNSVSMRRVSSFLAMDRLLTGNTNIGLRSTSRTVWHLTSGL